MRKVDDQERQALYRRLSDVDALRDQGGNWVAATYNTVSRFPAELQDDIKTFVARRERENAKRLAGIVKDIHSKLQKLLNSTARKDEIKEKMEHLGQVRASIVDIDNLLAMTEAENAASLLSHMWDLLGGREGGEPAK